MIHALIKNNYSKYFTHYTIKNFAGGLFSIFIPIYLYANGFSLFQVGAFYLVQEIINFFFTYVLYQKIYDWRIRSMIILAVLSQILLIVLTYRYLSASYIFLFTLACIKGMHDSFYWGTYGLCMVHLSSKKTGQFLGKWYFLNTVFSTAVIPLSGYILDNYSPFWLVIISVILLVLCMIPLLSMKLEPLENNTKINISSFLHTKENQYIFIMSHLNEFFTKIQQTFAPIFIFITFNKFFSVGIAALFSVIGEGMYSLATGNYSDKKSTRKKLLYFNAIGFVVPLLLIIVIKGYALFALLTALAFFRVGTVISSETGINKSCQTGKCYSKKLFGRLAENIAGMVVGMVIMMSGLFGFHVALMFCAAYIVVIFLRITRFAEYI